MRAFSLIATCVYGVAALLLIVFPRWFATETLNWFSEWWGVFTALHLVGQLLPIVWILYWYPNTKESWAWEFKRADIVSSYILGILIIFVAPFAARALAGQDFLFWQHKFWFYSAVAAVGEIFIAMIEQRIEKLAPAAPAAAGAGAAAGAAAH